MRYVLTTLSIILCFAAVGSAQTGTTGTITGSILDPNDAVILGTEVTVSSGSFSRSAFPEPRSGRFSFEVPAGIYTITTKQTEWFSVRRASFIVRNGETTTIDLRPRLYFRSQALVVDRNGRRDAYEYYPRAKVEEFLPFSDSPSNVFVEFETKQGSGDTTEYRNAFLTYNALSISADLIQVDRKTLSVHATGGVVIDHDGTHKKSNSFKLHIERPSNVLKNGGQPLSANTSLKEKVISAGWMNSRATNFEQPAYPKNIKKPRPKAQVDVRILTDADGNVISADVIRGPVEFHDAALTAARKLKFPPTTLSGVPAKVSGWLSYRFNP